MRLSQITFLMCAPVLAGLLITGQTPAASEQQAPPEGSPLIRSETKLVLVDAVVTDKKGNYVHGLTMKDFRIFEDKKEQTVKTFSIQSDPASPYRAQKHYMVLFFNNTGMKVGDQMQARQAAVKFIDANTGPNQLIAIANYNGNLKITQNFTGDPDRLKKVVNGPDISATSGVNFGNQTLLLAFRDLAKGLLSVPGRKTLVFLTAGLQVRPDEHSYLTAAIDMCNRANVAVYPLDVRGLAAPAGFLFNQGAPRLQLVAYVPAAAPPMPGAGGNTGSRSTPTAPPRTNPAGNAGANRSGAPGGLGGGAGRSIMNPNNRPRTIVPPFPKGIMETQQDLYVLAEATGGFVIANTNDLVSGLEKIQKEQEEYYILGYTPSNEDDENSCHSLSVKIDKGGTVVRSRSGYCNAKPQDLLAGSATEKDLEARAAGAQTGTVAASLAAPFFYTSPNTARVDVAMEIPAENLKFEKQKGKFHLAVNVLGIAYTHNGKVAARFSDTVRLEFENKKEVEAFEERPLHYEKQFDIASGQYQLKVVFSSGGKDFGKLEAPLMIDAWDTDQFSLSGVALSKDIHKMADAGTSLDAELIDGNTPLVVQGLQMTPYGAHDFKKAENAALYVEIYEPLLAGQDPPKVGLQIRVLDRKTGEQKVDSGFTSVANLVQAGNPVVPVGMKLPMDRLTPGAYRLELKAADSAGHTSPVRAVDIDVQ